MIENNYTSWFLIAYTFGILGLAAYLIRNYAEQYKDLKDKIHAIHALIELIDESMKDDKVTKEEFTALIKRCLAVLAELL